MIPINATPKMGQTHFPNLLQQSTKFQTYPFLPTPTPPHLPKPNPNPNPNPRTLRISCSSKEKDITNDEILAIELGLQIKKLNTNMVQREEALNKSRELLFTEMCSFVEMKSDDMKKKWKRMNEDEKWDLSRVFVAEWSAHFHPLSAKSVKDLVEEFVGQENESSNDDVSLIGDLRKLLGFSQNSDT